LWAFLHQDTPSLPESSEKFGVILKVLPPLLGALVGGTIGFTSSYLMWKKQNRFNQKNIARALYGEISHLEEHLKKLLEHDSLLIALPIYSEQGLFFIFTKEISFFEPELSTKIFDFYGWLNQAENIRQIDTEKVAYGVVEREANRLIESKKWIKTNELLPEVAEKVMKTGNNAVVNREALIERLYNTEYSKMIERKIYLIKDSLRKAYPYIQILKQLLQNEFDSCPKSDL